MIISFEGEEFFPTMYKNYYVSKSGKIYSTNSKKLLTAKHDKDGYLEYAISVNGKPKYLRGHRLVAMTFLQNKENKPTVNHKNGIKDDNRVDNLEWATYSENNLHRYRVLNAQAPEKWNVDVYKNGKLIKAKCDKQSLIKLGFSHTYLKCIQENRVNKFFYFCEKIDKKFIVYWNGEIYKQFDDVKKASEFFNLNLNSVYVKATHHKARELLTRDYHLIFH